MGLSVFSSFFHVFKISFICFTVFFPSSLFSIYLLIFSVLEAHEVVLELLTHNLLKNKFTNENTVLCIILCVFILTKHCFPKLGFCSLSTVWLYFLFVAELGYYLLLVLGFPHILLDLNYLFLKKRETLPWF